jgi:hypothetical protein
MILAWRAADQGATIVARPPEKGAVSVPIEAGCAAGNTVAIAGRSRAMG